MHNHIEPHTNVTPFDFHGHEVRVITIAGSEPRWVAADVANVLGLGRTHDMVRALDDDEKGADTIRTPSGPQEMTTITESGLYSCILRSRKPEAKEFKRWVTREVLPSIRRHGAYMTDQAIEQVLTDPDTIIKLATDLKRERARVDELRPAAESWEHLAAPGGDYSVAGAAKVLSRDPVIEIGRDRLFRHMAALGWVFKTQGKRAHWEAYQGKGIKTGRLTHKLGGGFINEKSGEWEQAAPTVRITPKGLHELHVSLGGSGQLALTD